MILTNHSYMLYQFRRELIQKLMENYNVVLSMPYVGHEEDFKEMGCRCIETPIDRRGINPKTDWKLIRTYLKMLKEEKPDMVVTYSIKPNIYAGLVCSLLNIPYCANVQGLGTAFQKPGLAEFVTILYKLAFRKVKTVFFENKENAREFRKRKILSQNQQTILPGAGVNLEHYTYFPYKEADSIHFLFVGRVMEEKGVNELFRAMKALKKQYGEKVVLDMIGFFEDEYKQEVEELQKEDIVKFHGFQEEVRPFYKKAHCVVLPSYHEGMSNVLLEAAASGRALITSDIPGCREAVSKGINGYLCKVKNAKDLYKKMQQFVELSPEEREMMGQKGRQKMKKQFAKEMVVEKTIRAIVD
nr:glycosyltransferase family 4 protein [Anaerostipes faecalis]